MNNANPHEFMSRNWYRWTHDQHAEIHQIFCAWVSHRLHEIETVLEIGCGKHDFYHHCFADQEYLGIDVCRDAVNYCRLKHEPIAKHLWITGDFLIFDFQHLRFDLIFSHAVIDHSPDPTAFVKKTVELATYYVYHKTYRGYFDDIAEHRQQPSGNPADKDCYVDVSVQELDRVLGEMQKAGELKQYELKSVPTGRGVHEISQELHIVVEK